MPVDRSILIGSFPGDPPPSNLTAAVNDAAGIVDSATSVLVPGGGAITHGRQVNATNTGIAGAGISPASLTVTGATTYSTPGQTITGKDFTGTVTITADNVTLSGCRVTTSGTGVRGVWVKGNNVTLVDCTVRSPTAMWIVLDAWGDNLTIRRCDAGYGENICTTGCAVGPVFELSYLHDANTISDPAGHPDLVEVYSSSDVIFDRCRLVMPRYTTAPINIAPYYGNTSVTRTTIKDCYIGGGQAHIIVDLQSTGTITYTRVLRCDFDGNTSLGDYSAFQNNDGRAVVNTEAALTANPNAILWPTTGVDVSRWADCSAFTPDRTGQIVSP